jgi:hypothetical protein
MEKASRTKGGSRCWPRRSELRSWLWRCRRTAPASMVSPSRAPIKWRPPPVSVKPAAPVDGKPVASWKVYLHKPDPAGAVGFQREDPLDRSGEVTFVHMINNVDGSVIWARIP